MSECIIPVWAAERCQSVQSVMAKSQKRGHKNWHQVKTWYYCLRVCSPWHVVSQGFSASFYAKPDKSNSDWPVAK